MFAVGGWGTEQWRFSPSTAGAIGRCGFGRASTRGGCTGMLTAVTCCQGASPGLQAPPCGSPRCPSSAASTLRCARKGSPDMACYDTLRGMSNCCGSCTEDSEDGLHVHLQESTVYSAVSAHKPHCGFPDTVCLSIMYQAGCVTCAGLLQNTHHCLCSVHGVWLHPPLPALGVHYAR